MQTGSGGFIKYILFTPVVIIYTVAVVPILIIACSIDSLMETYEELRDKNTSSKE